MIRDPDTGRRVSRPNDEALRQVARVPELSVVDAATFAAVQALLASRGGPQAFTRRPKHLLSGLLRCVCGSGMSVYGRQRDGRIRVRCTAAAENRSCPAPGSFYLDPIVDRVLAGLKTRLLLPRRSKPMSRPTATNAAASPPAAPTNAGRPSAGLSPPSAKADRCVDLLVRGIGDAARLDLRARQLRDEIERLRVSLAGALPAIGDRLVVHPAAVSGYRRKLDQLASLVAEGQPVGGESAELIRGLIDEVSIARDDGGGTRITVRGRLNALVGSPPSGPEENRIARFADGRTAQILPPLPSLPPLPFFLVIA